MQTEKSSIRSALQADNTRDNAREILHTIPTVRIFVLSCLAARLSESNFGQLAGLRLTEARILLVLGVIGTSNLERLIREMNLEKGLASRSIKSLVEGGLVSREPNLADGRSMMLSLTDDGQQLFQGLYSNVRAWNEDWMSVLKKAERETFLHCVEKLIDAAREKGRQKIDGDKARQSS